jgi:cobalt-zinc-cadmium resistance protein CzcA
MQGQWQQAVQEYIKDKSSVDHYKGSALKNAELLLKQSALAFRSGEIDYTELWLTTRNAIEIRDNYLSSLNNLNQSVITLEFLAGVN